VLNAQKYNLLSLRSLSDDKRAGDIRRVLSLGDWTGITHKVVVTDKVTDFSL